MFCFCNLPVVKVERFIKSSIKCYFMKQKLSISMEEELVTVVETIVKEGRFRNKSHIIEYALKRFLER